VEFREGSQTLKQICRAAEWFQRICCSPPSDFMLCHNLGAASVSHAADRNSSPLSSTSVSAWQSS